MASYTRVLRLGVACIVSPAAPDLSIPLLNSAAVFFFFMFIYLLCVCLAWGGCDPDVWSSGSQRTLVRVDFLLPPCVFQGLDSGHW